MGVHENRAGRIFILGSLVMACTVRVARLPEPGESLLGSSFLIEPGGKGFNQAIGARRLGATVGGLFAIGDDLFGAIAREAFVAQGLDPAMLVRRAGATGAGVGMIGAGGENSIVVAPGVNADPTLAGGVDLVARLAAVAVTIAQFEIGDEPILTGFAAARGADALTILNPSPFRTIAPAILAATDLIVVNRGEAAALAADLGCTVGGEYAALAARLQAIGVDTLVVTLGADGAIGWRDGVCLRQPAFAVTARDATGAGDAFLAGLATALAFGRGFAEALRDGAACGAIVARADGVLAALPTAEELAAFLG